jgi:low affinity Fe/Cu permease
MLEDMNDFFRRFSVSSANAMGSPWAFVASALIVAIWAFSGPLFDYSDTWQLVINTGTTVLTFLAVFLIQNTQNRDAKAIHLKLDELIKSADGARNRLVDVEGMPDEQMDELHEEFLQLRDEEEEVSEEAQRAAEHARGAAREAEHAEAHAENAEEAADSARQRARPR